MSSPTDSVNMSDGSISCGIAATTYHSPTASSLSGLWALSSPMNASSQAISYAPYGQSRPPTFTRPDPEPASARPIASRDGLRPWERATKSGQPARRRRKTGPTSKSAGHSEKGERGLDGTIARNQSIRSSTWAPVVPRPPPFAGYGGVVPSSGDAQAVYGITAPFLGGVNQLGPQRYQPGPDTAQAAIAAGRKRSFDAGQVPPQPLKAPRRS